MGLGLDVDISLIYQYATSDCEGSGATAQLEPSPFANIMIVVCSGILSLIFTEISPYETPQNGASGMGMHCLYPIKSSLKLIVSYPLRMHNENEKLGGKDRLITKSNVKRNDPAS